MKHLQCKLSGLVEHFCITFHWLFVRANVAGAILETEIHVAVVDRPIFLHIIGV